MSIHLAIFGKPRYLGLVDLQEISPEINCRLVVETMRGTELAILGGPLSAEQEEKYRNSCGEDGSDSQLKGGEPPLQEIAFLRKATFEDMQWAAREREEENEVLLKGREILKNHNLSMKLVDVEFLLDRKKLFFYFTSEQRVDFRAFVRDLAKEFKTRIELRQIGVRDEAKAVKGISPCGRPCCCSYWLHRFTPICIKMVKEQNLALNPTKISGICGRLMCCMSFEHHLYDGLWKDLPNPGSKIRTPAGNFLMEGVELATETARIRTPEGKEIRVKTENFQQFKEALLAGKSWDDAEVKDSRRGREESAFSARKKTAEAPAKAGGGKIPDKQERPESAKGPSSREQPPQRESAGRDEPSKKRRRRRKKPSQGEKPQNLRESPPAKSPQSGRKQKETKDGEPDSQGIEKKKQGARRRRPQKSGREMGASNRPGSAPPSEE